MCKFFKESEFVRVGCSISDLNPESLERLDRAREIAGVPFVINSAYRSPDYEREHGRSGSGAHTLGRAFDVACKDSLCRYRIIFGAISAGFTRIGIGKTFVHLDDALTLPNPRIWLY